MLRLSKIHQGQTEVVLKLEGQIVGEWVDLVARECAEAADGTRQVSLDLADVTYADTRGLAMLRSLDPRRVRIVNTAPLLEDQLRQRGERS